MYFEIEDPKEYREKYSSQYKNDDSKLKTFEHLVAIEAEEEIVISKEQATK